MLYTWDLYSDVWWLYLNKTGRKISRNIAQSDTGFAITLVIFVFSYDIKYNLIITSYVALNYLFGKIILPKLSG